MKVEEPVVRQLLQGLARLGEVFQIAHDHFFTREAVLELAEVARNLAEDGRLEDPANAPDLLSLATLATAGIQTRFNFESLSVQLTIPTELRRSRDLSLLGSPNLTAARTIPPSDFSAYFNVRGGIDYIESSRVTPPGFDQPQFALESALNLRGLVLENETDINAAPNKTWQKRDTRLVWDQPKQRIRWTAGDLDYPVIGFQGFVPMLGLSLNRQDSLQPYRITSPLGQSAFFLKQDSKVEIIINGRAVQTVQMNAGPHQISNFPLTGGANDVALRITDPVGRVEYINATRYYDPGLLKAGETEFNYALGLPSIIDPQSPFYHYSSQPAASAYHLWGITDRLTAGLNAQLTPNTQQGGLQAILSTPVGTLALDSGFDYDRAPSAPAPRSVSSIIATLRRGAPSPTGLLVFPSSI